MSHSHTDQRTESFEAAAIAAREEKDEAAAYATKPAAAVVVDQIVRGSPAGNQILHRSAPA